MNPSCRWQNPIMSRRRWQRDQTPIQKQTKHRELQQTKHKGSPANQTQSTEVFIKKKKNPQYTNQNQTL